MISCNDIKKRPAGRKPRRRRGGTAPEGREEAFQPLFLCAAKKKPLAVKRKRQRGRLRRNKLHIPHPAASGRSRPFRCSSFSHANRFAGFAREPLLWNPLKTTKKGVETPFLEFPQEFGLCKRIFQVNRNRDADAKRADRRGSRNTLR